MHVFFSMLKREFDEPVQDFVMELISLFFFLSIFILKKTLMCYNHEKVKVLDRKGTGHQQPTHLPLKKIRFS